MNIMELKRDIYLTKRKLADLASKGKASSIEFTEALGALLALQDSLIHALDTRDITIENVA